MPGSRDAHRGQDSYFPDFAKKCQSVYFFLSWFYACRRSTILGLCIIHDPQGVYYGGTIAAPVIKSIFEAVLERVWPHFRF